MRPESQVNGLLILRPLLAVNREILRQHLVSSERSWREDPSNASDAYLRNRLRRLLSEVPRLNDRLLLLSRACEELTEWLHEVAPVLDSTFEVSQLCNVPAPLARESARAWLMERGAPPGELMPDVIDRLIAMARDAGSLPRMHFPGRLLVRRRNGKIFAESPASRLLQFRGMDGSIDCTL